MIYAVTLFIFLLVFHFVREALVDRVLERLWNCEARLAVGSLHYTASHPDNIAFETYYKAYNEVNERKTVIAVVEASKVLRLFKKFMTPNERKYYNSFVDKISQVSMERDRAYLEYQRYLKETGYSPEEPQTRKVEVKIKRKNQKQQSKFLNQQKFERRNYMKANAKSL